MTGRLLGYRRATTTDATRTSTTPCSAMLPSAWRGLFTVS